MRQLAHQGRMVGVEYTSKRYDMGSKLGILQAAVEVGVKHPELAAAFRAYLKDFVKTL